MPQIAPRVAGWQRRLGGQAGPLGAVSAGSGESPNASPLQVELFIAGSWVDITSFVMTRDGSGTVNLFRGQSDEGTQTDPGRCTLQLNNRDGRFSPRNPTSPYYGLIGRNTPLRVSVPSGNAKSYRFWGEVSAWPQYWDSTGTDVWVDLEAAGILRRLGQGATPLRSTMRREFSNPSRGSIVAYWPCEDGAGATQVASGLLTGQPMAISTGVTLATYSDWPASDPIPTIGAGSLTGLVTDYAVTSQQAVRFFLALPASGVAAPATVLTLTGTGTATRWAVGVTAAGDLTLSAFDSFGTSVFSTSVAFGANGLQLSVGFELTQAGADVTWTLFTQNIGSSLLTLSFGGTVVGQTFGELTSVRVGGGGDLGATVVAHIAVADSITAYTDTGGALLAYVGESTSARSNRLCREEGIPFTEIFDGVLGDTVVMGAQTTKTFLELMEEVMFAADSIFLELLTVVGLGRRTRLSRYNQAPALALSYPAFHLSEVPVPVDDDQHTRNAVTASRPGGSSFQVEKQAGSLSVQPAPMGVGRYDTSITTNVSLDTALPHQAGWRLLLGTVDEARYPKIAINLAHPSFAADGAMRQQALAVRLGDRITISDPPAWIPPDDISQIVIGISESIDGFQHRITYTCVPESPYRVAVLGSDTTGRIDTAGGTLAAPVSAVDTALSVSTASGPVWTTDSAEWPFDIRMGGERMTVTAVSGATSPQTFTVTRSVNGVVKTHAAGADIRLDQPMTLAL